MSDNEEDHAHQPSTDDVTAEQLLPPIEVQQYKLCGYLNKQTGIKGLKKWTSRYCLFNDEECKLYLFNSKLDSTSCGCIDISAASFIYHVASPSQFSIVTGKQEHVMQAHNEEAMMYWLTQLQRKRHQFSESRKKSCSATLLQENTAGLVGVTDKESCYDQLPAPDYIQEPVGSCYSNKPSTWKSFKLSSLKIPVRNPFPSFISQGHNFRTTSQSFSVDTVKKSESENPDEMVPRQQSKKTNLEWWRNITGRSSYEHCAELQEKVDQLEKELIHRQQELSDKDKLNDFLQEQIRDQDMKGKILTDQTTIQADDSQEEIDMNKSILVLQRSLDNMSKMKSNVEDELREAQQTVEKLREEISSYQEIILIKDNVVMEISNQLADMTERQHNKEVAGATVAASTSTNSTITATANNSTTNTNTSQPQDGAAQCYSEIEKLREAVEAYKEKNMFLANEILEMNRLRSDDAELIAAKSRQNDQLQTELTRIQSRYLVLLEEMNKPQIGAESPINPELVHRMLEDAMETMDATSNPLENSSYYDSYGFNHKHLLEDSVAVESVSGMVNQQLQLLEDTGASKRVRWLQYMNDHQNSDFQHSNELKQMIRGGIPNNYRCKIWNCNLNRYKRPTILSTRCIKYHLGKDYIPNKYRSLLEENVNRTSVALSQIELDLLRTLPNNHHYQNPDDKGIMMLRRVLAAFSWYSPSVGYCQGLNRLAAIALLFVDEEMAFWYLVVVVQHFMPDGYYGSQLVASQADQRVLRDLIVEKLPRLSAHIDHHKVDYSPVTFNWFLTVYVDTVPTETMLQIWDSFMYEGSKVLFRYAIALFKSNEEQLLKLDSHSAIFNQLRRMGKLAYDPIRLSQIAFRELSSFPMKIIHQKRLMHMRQVEAEQQEVSKQRERYHQLSQRRHHSNSNEQITDQP